MLCSSYNEICNLANHMKKWNKEHQTFSFQFFTNRFSILMFLVLFFHLVCKISNFNMWTAKHLAQASCTELTLQFLFIHFLSMLLIYRLLLLVADLLFPSKTKGHTTYISTYFVCHLNTFIVPSYFIKNIVFPHIITFQSTTDLGMLLTI